MKKILLLSALLTLIPAAIAAPQPNPPIKQTTIIDYAPPPRRVMIWRIGWWIYLLK